MAFGRLSSLNTCSTRLLAFTATFVVVVGQNMAPNNVQAPTECENYVISFGGSFSRRHYTCCEKPTTTGTPSPCKEEPPISNFQCKQPNTAFSEKKNVSKSFNCNGQTGQQNALKRCTSRWGWLEQSTGGCWAFSSCFGGACEAEVESAGSSVSDAFCGDGRCDAAIEDSDSCPIDCCPYERPDRCQIVNNTCPDECCGHHLCCNKPSTGGSVGSALGGILLWIVVGIAGFVVLVNICCCIFCICCARCCKRKDKKNKKHKKGDEMSTRV